MSTEHDHDRPNSDDPTEWEYVTETDDGATVMVSKVGGGTIGRSYDGAWHWSYDLGMYHAEGSDMSTGTPSTHAQAAGTVADFMGEETR